MKTRPPSLSSVADVDARPRNFDEPLTIDGAVPRGYEAFSVSRGLLESERELASERLMSWDLHRRVGFAVWASDDYVRSGSLVLLGWGVRHLRIACPCRVVETWESSTRTGFTYETLDGHPEAGLEQFMVHTASDRSVRFTVSAVSRPAWAAARIGRPVASAVQKVYTRRYLRCISGS